MKSEHEELVREVMKLIGDKAPKEKTLDRAREVKIVLSNEWNDLTQALFAIDNAVTSFFPNEEWTRGFWNPNISVRATPTVVRQVVRPSPAIPKQAVLDIAMGLRATGHKKVTARDMIEQLRTRGDSRPPKDIGTSVGNILTKSGKWKRIGPGEYKPIAQEDEEVK